MTAAQDIARDLERLHEEYAYRVNFALEEDREDLVWQLADAYADAALLAIISASSGTTSMGRDDTLKE